MVTDPTLVEAVAMLRACATVKTHADGAKILATLADFVDNDKLVFDNKLPANRYGESTGKSFWPHLRVNDAFSDDPDTTSAVIAHELIHLVSTVSDGFDEEINCRDFDARYAIELIGGFSYADPSAPSTIKTAKLTTSSQLWKHYQDQIAAASADQVVDRILAVHTYDEKITADWVIKHINDYGGLRNRWGTSLAKYVAALVRADKRPAYYAPYIIQVLQAIPAAYWVQAKPDLGDFKRFAAMMSYIEKLPAPTFAADIARLETRFGEKLRLF